MAVSDERSEKRSSNLPHCGIMVYGVKSHLPPHAIQVSRANLITVPDSVNPSRERRSILVLHRFMSAYEVFDLRERLFTVIDDLL